MVSVMSKKKLLKKNFVGVFSEIEITMAITLKDNIQNS